MDRLATGVMIALAALFMSGGFVRDVAAAEAGVKPPAGAQPVASPAPVVNGLRSELVLSLVLTLEALRAAPANLADARKV
jgi:hypothetical protein